MNKFADDSNHRGQISKPETEEKYRQAISQAIELYRSMEKCGKAVQQMKKE